MENFVFVSLFKRVNFLSRAVQSHPMYLLSSYVIYISRNYIPLSHPDYMHHTKYTQKVDKPMIYLMTESEADMIIHKRGDMR